MEHEDLIVSMKGIQKSFGGVHALTDGELTLRKGEVLGLIGENGAGKSTLMKILSGVYQADAGVMLVDGKEVSMQVKVGDKVIFSKYSGTEIETGEDDEKFVIVKQNDILAVIE